MKNYTFKDLQFNKTDMPKVKEAKLVINNHELLVYEDLMTNHYVTMQIYIPDRHICNIVTKEYPLKESSKKLISDLIRDIQLLRRV